MVANAIPKPSGEKFLSVQNKRLILQRIILINDPYPTNGGRVHFQTFWERFNKFTNLKPLLYLIVYIGNNRLDVFSMRILWVIEYLVDFIIKN